MITSSERRNARGCGSGRLKRSYAPAALNLNRGTRQIAVRTAVPIERAAQTFSITTALRFFRSRETAERWLFHILESISRHTAGPLSL